MLPLSEELIAKGLALGFDDVGICPATIPSIDLEAWKSWLEKGMHADLAYMESPLRTDPSTLLEGAKTAIVFVTYYKQPSHTPQNHSSLDRDHRSSEESASKVLGEVKDESKNENSSGTKALIASYARHRDYHHLHRKRLKQFVSWLDTRFEHKYLSRGFSDSAPLLEKSLAVQAGLGWFGKNTLLIHRRFGTYTLLSVCLTQLPVEHYAKAQLHAPRCGSCMRCLEACPTQALTEYKLDARLCLSYHTIESTKPIPQAIAAKNPGYLFGCDICQEVCPHNKLKPISETSTFDESLGQGPYLSRLEIESMSEQQLWGTPLQRRKKEGLLYTLSTLDSR